MDYFFDCMGDDIDVAFDVLCVYSHWKVNGLKNWFYRHLGYKLFFAKDNFEEFQRLADICSIYILYLVLFDILIEVQYQICVLILMTKVQVVKWKCSLKDNHWAWLNYLKIALKWIQS